MITMRFHAAMLLAVCQAAFLHNVCIAGSLGHQLLRDDLAQLTDGFDGRVGVCVHDGSGTTCLRPDEHFSLQSVMKLVVGAAALDSIDRGTWKLDSKIVVYPRDLSLFVQPMAKLVTPAGYRTTVGDLIRRAIVESDSTAADVLISQLGGPAEIQDFLNRKTISGIRIDRDERHLQTEILGLEWRPEFIDKEILNRAIAAVPDAERDAAYRGYREDIRDTATPSGMGSFLYRLASGKLLSPTSTKYILEVMQQTTTFPDRLKAGVPKDWSLAHKTGTSNTWKQVTAATNDVGVLVSPAGDKIAIAVFVADSRAPAKARANLIAEIARTVIESYRQ
jgi:beta-lactamase class A